MQEFTWVIYVMCHKQKVEAISRRQKRNHFAKNDEVQTSGQVTALIQLQHVSLFVARMKGNTDAKKNSTELNTQSTAFITSLCCIA